MAGPDPQNNEHDPTLDDYFQREYDELRSIARQLLRGERSSHTLQPTSLVHEAWLRLEDSGAATADEQMFRRLVVRTMRRALIDHARRRSANKRAAHVRIQIDMDGLEADSPEFDTIDLLALDEALDRIAATESRLARILEMRIFGGLTIVEIAATLDLSSSHVQRLLTHAFELLREE